MTKFNGSFQQRQQGAFLLTTALALLFLLGFMGLAVDFGRLFVVKTELQTAMDSCALAAAKELNGEPDAVVRARKAGLHAGNLNRVHFQSQGAGLMDDDVQFSDRLIGPYNATPIGEAKYVRCQRSVTGLAPLLLQAMDAFAATSVGGDQSVVATAVATLLPAQTNCLMPVGICQRRDPATGALKPYQRGEWIPGVTNSNEDMEASGQFRWLDFNDPDNPTGGTRTIKDLLLKGGKCDLPGKEADVDVSESGKKTGAVEAWNTRFFVDKNGEVKGLLDTTGYAWYVAGSTVPEAMKGRYGDTVSGYAYHQSKNSPYQGNRMTDVRGLTAETGNQRAATKEEHAKGVANSRVIAVAEIDCGAPKGAVEIKAFACVFMLHPLQKGQNNGVSSRMWLEYISDATATSDNPCVTVGLPGSGEGQRVPGLVK